MAFNNEIERVKAEIKVLEKKLSLLEEIEKHITPCEEAYKRVYGFYPETYEDSWTAFQDGYKSAQKDYKVGEYQETVEERGEVHKDVERVVKESVKWCEEHPNENPLDCLKPQTAKRKIDDLAEKLLPDDHPYKITDEHGETNPYKQYLNSVKDWEPKPQNEKQVEEGLREAFREAVKQGVVSSVENPKDDFMERMVAELKGKTLEDIVTRWWCDTFSTHEKWSMEECIDDLIDQIHLWIPKEQSAAGSQNAYVECSVEGFNDAIKKIKSKLRNKKDT